MMILSLNENYLQRFIPHEGSRSITASRFSSTDALSVPKCKKAAEKVFPYQKSNKKPLFGVAFCLLLPILVELGDGFHSSEELLEQVAFVRRMDCVSLEAEAHQERIDAQNLLHLGKHGDGAAAA